MNHYITTDILACKDLHPVTSEHVSCHFWLEHRQVLDQVV